MRRLTCALLITVIANTWTSSALAQFSSGSDESDGTLSVSGEVTLPLPPDGIFNFSTVTIESGGILNFERNTLNTPVYILATGDIVVDGVIDVSGQDGDGTTGGQGGPGGFNGGPPEILGNDASSGFGPGAGGPGTNTGSSGGAGNGAYGAESPGTSENNGEAYGSALLVPLVGGSGGGGSTNAGGCGGGGAVMLASDSRVEINGSIDANTDCQRSYGNGSGGGVRIVSPVVSGNGRIYVNGAISTPIGQGGHGRVRIDTIDQSELGDLEVVPDEFSAISLGSFMAVFPNIIPRLDVVEAAGTAIPEGSSGPVDIVLPLDSPSAQTIVVQATDFSGTVPIAVAITPNAGARMIYEAEIDMGTGNPASVNVQVNIPANVPVKVSAWTR